MTQAQYRQMIGRAGRAGIDSKGESFLIVPKHEVNIQIIFCNAYTSHF